MKPLSCNVSHRSSNCLIVWGSTGTVMQRPFAQGTIIVLWVLCVQFLFSATSIHDPPAPPRTGIQRNFQSTGLPLLSTFTAIGLRPRLTLRGGVQGFGSIPTTKETLPDNKRRRRVERGKKLKVRNPSTTGRRRRKYDGLCLCGHHLSV